MLASDIDASIAEKTADGILAMLASDIDASIAEKSQGARVAATRLGG